MYLVLALTGVLAGLVYVLVVFRAVPGVASERLGDLPPLPSDLGHWREEGDSALGRTARDHREIREVRTWLRPSSGLFSSNTLVQQVRYKDAQSGEILRAEPDRKLKRRRVKS